MGKGSEVQWGKYNEKLFDKISLIDQPRQMQRDVSVYTSKREGKRGRLLFNWNFVIIWMISYKFNIFYLPLSRSVFACSFFMSSTRCWWTSEASKKRNFKLNFKLTSNSCINAAKRAQQLKNSKFLFNQISIDENSEERDSIKKFPSTTFFRTQQHGNQ